MSFVWKRPEGRLRTPEQVMGIIIKLVDGLNPFDKRGACICAGMCVSAESDFWLPWNAAEPTSKNYEFDSQSDDGRSVGYCQQQTGPDGELWWGPVSQEMSPEGSIGEFLKRLIKNGYNASSAQTANDSVQAVQRSGVPQGYRGHWNRINALYDSVKGAAPTSPPPTPPVGYGMPTGSNSGGYGGNGVRFPDWVYALGNAFNVKPSTYPGHQETDRIEAGYARNPAHLNRGIDWAGSVADMQRFAEYLMTVRGSLEQEIWENPDTGQRIGVAGGMDIGTGYYDSDWANHRNHVHTRQSASIPQPGGTQPAPPPSVSGPWTGDPVWLPDVLRAEGLTVIEEPGWLNSGHGDMGSLWGVVNHHTGSNNSTWQSIRNGRPDLAGPLAHIHLRRDGVVELVAVGVCWHAGTGNYADLGRGMGNQRTIGIEAQNDGGGSPGKPHRSSWPDVQYDALVKCNAAIGRRLGVGASHSISHQEYDKGDPPTFEGKWDPGAIDMNIFRADVAARLGQPPTQGEGFLMALSDSEQREVLDYLRWLAAPGTGEFRKKFESRSAVRDPGEGAVDTITGMELNSDGNVDFLATYLRAQLKYTPAVDRLKRVAAGVDPGRPGLDALLAQAMLAESAKKPAVVVTTAAAPVAPAVANNVAPMAVAPADTRELADAYAEIARLRDDNARLQAAASTPPTPVPAVLAQAMPAMTSGDHASKVIDSVEDWTEHILSMDTKQRAAFVTSMTALALPNGSQS